jgi:beta-glucosidase
MWIMKELVLAIASFLYGKEALLNSNQALPNSGNNTSPGSGDNSQFSPPFYPSPWMSGQGDWADAYEKARDFVSQLTLLEKVNLTTGVGWEGEQCVGQVLQPRSPISQHIKDTS